MSKNNGKQTENRRSNGQFAKGNTLGTVWKKGQSGNPKGRHGSLSDIFNELSEVKVEGQTRKTKLCDKVYTLAERGNLKAVEIIFDRTEGKAINRTLDISEEPIVIFKRDK